MLTVGSLFSGIGGLDLGLERAGCEVRWQVENDPYCNRVLAKHWPDVPRYGDIKELDPNGLERVDLVCGGFPCQDLSVAGGRAGLAGERSGLFHEFMRVVDSLAPRWVLIENVPGLLSSNDGRDMGTVLGVLADLGYGWCYRVLDAQYFGVAQRRRRVFIVGCVGDAASAAAVLLEPQSCGGNLAPSREAGQGVAALTANGIGTCGADDNQGQAGHLIPEVNAVPSLVGCQTPGERWDGETETFLPSWTGGAQQDVVPTLVAYPLAMRGRDDGAEFEMGQEGTYNALRAGNGGSTLANWVAFSENQRAEVLETDYARQLTTGGGKPGQGYPAVRQGMAVRRLTPTECERLQSFPDGWTADETDGARYRMLGNAVCVNVAAWIAERIVTVDQQRQAA